MRDNLHFPKALVHGFYIEQHAEMSLINPILKNQIFGQELNYFFSKYPVSPLSEKGNLVCTIMEGLWPGAIGTKQFSVFKDFEIFLTSLGKRDHFFHQFLVFLIGVNIISEILNRISPEKKLDVFGFENDHDIFITWLMTSTYHDFGYPLSAADDVVRQLSSFYSGIGLEKISSTILSFLDNNPIGRLFLDGEQFVENPTDSFHQSPLDFLSRQLKKQLSLDESELSKILSHLKEDRSHGYISAIMLCNSIINDPNSSIYIKHLEHAAPAIVGHIFSGKLSVFQKRISFSQNPYSFLLFLIDNIQDWSRVVSESDKYANFTLTKFHINQGTNSICMDYYLSNNSWSSDMELDARNEILKRKNTINQPMNDLNCGLNLELNYFFQFSENPESISISL